MAGHLPSIISLHPSQASQVSQHPSYHARNPRHTLQENEPREPLSLRHLEFGVSFLARFRMSVSCHGIHPPSQQPDGSKCQPIGPVLGFAVGDLHFAHLLIGVARIVSPPAIDTRGYEWIGLTQGEPTGFLPRGYEAPSEAERTH